MTTEAEEFTVIKSGMRLDQFLTFCRPDLTRSRLSKLIQEGLVTLNGLLAKPSGRRGRLRLAKPADSDKEPSAPTPTPLCRMSGW